MTTDSFWIFKSIFDLYISTEIAKATRLANVKIRRRKQMFREPPLKRKSYQEFEGTLLVG